MSGFYYLASPYTKYRYGLDRACADVCMDAALLIESGISVYTPIGHCHQIAMSGDLNPLDHSIWLPMQRPMMDAAKGMILLQLPDWDTSFGIGEEIKVFEAARKPIIHMKPGIIPHELIGEVSG